MPEQNYDVKKARRTLYAPPSTRFVIVDVPPLSYLMIDGHGDPNTSTAYADAVQTLYRASYSVRAVALSELGRPHTVGPLEGLWWAPDMSVFHTGAKQEWNWTMMIVQPDDVTAAMVDSALVGADIAPSAVRFDCLDEGRCVQILHVGSYDDEGPNIDRMHTEFLPANGLEPTGHHHEIYLSDPRRVAPAKLRTILRQPVRTCVQ